MSGAADVSGRTDDALVIKERIRKRQVPQDLHSASSCKIAVYCGRRAGAGLHVTCSACIKEVGLKHAKDQARADEPLASCPAHSDHAHIAMAHAVKLIQDAGYTGIILYEAEICHKHIGKKKKGRMDITLPGLCVFEVHGPEHEQRKARSATCSSDMLKRAYSSRQDIQLVELYRSDRDSWAAIIGAVVNRAYSTQV